MHVTVVIVAFRNADDIRACLTALSASTHTAYDAIVCENGGEEAFEALRRQVPERLPGGQEVRLVAADNPGYAGAINLCFRERPDSDAWLILNPDTELEPDALEHLVGKLATGRYDAVGGLLLNGRHHIQAYGGRWRPWLARAESLGIGRSLEDPVDVHEVEKTQNYIAGACILLGRRFLARAGPLREDYFLYCEEIDWCLRARSLGMRLGFEPKAHVIHNQGSTTGSGEAIRSKPKLPIYLDERNKILVTRDHYPWRLAVAAPSALLLIFLRYGRKGAWRQMGFALSGWAAGLLNRRGPPKWLAAN